MGRIRDINWNVEFDITVDGESVDIWALSESERAEIYKDIQNDYYSGTFLGDEMEDENEEDR